MDESLLTQLKCLSASDLCPMHMPGHKRREDVMGDALPYALDITEIHGFDDLHSRVWDDKEDGCLHRLSAMAADLYGCVSAFPLVGGSTVGILAAVRALVMLTGTSEILMARNCHKSVYHAVELTGVEPLFLCPRPIEKGISGKIDPAEVETCLNAHPSCRVVVLTSPTYEGVISSLAEIGRVVHDHGGYLIVDAAHGAHLPFVSQTPFEGADLVVVSLHKTLPSMTQTALLLVGSERVAPWRVARELGVFETSSPSYVLMTSVEECLRWAREHRPLFEDYVRVLSEARRALAEMKHLCLLQPNGAYDSGKLVICTHKATITGVQMAHRLRDEYGIEVEMAAPDHVIAMTSVCDVIPTKRGDTPIQRLVEALLEIDGGLCGQAPVPDHGEISIPERVMSACEALSRWNGTYGNLDDLQGRVAACYLWAYPPGVPFVIPGERLGAEQMEVLRKYERSHVDIRCVGGDGHLPDRIPVLKE